MPYTSAMALYEMPAKSPYQSPFRIFAWIAIILLLVILFFSLWIPQFSDETRKEIAWMAAAIVVVLIVIGNRLGIKEGTWKLVKRGYQVEVSDGQLIQRLLGFPTVEIPIDQIASLQQGRGGWLIITGGEPKRQVAVPSEIVGFESLQREISENRTVSPVRLKLSPWTFLPSASLVLACILVFVSHSRTVIMVAGFSALLLQVFSLFSLWRITRSHRRSHFITLTSILIFLILAWLVYERAASRL